MIALPRHTLSRRILSLGPLLALSACVIAPAAPGYVAQPGQGKDAAIFQADDAACHQQADASASKAAAPSGQTVAADPGAVYAQCMTAKGNSVTQSPAYAAYPTYNYAYAYPYPYPYAYPYPYPYYPYPAYFGGPGISFGFGVCCGGFHGYHGGYRR